MSFQGSENAEECCLPYSAEDLDRGMTFLDDQAGSSTFVSSCL